MNTERVSKWTLAAILLLALILIAAACDNPDSAEPPAANQPNGEQTENPGEESPSPGLPGDSDPSVPAGGSRPGGPEDPEKTEEDDEEDEDLGPRRLRIAEAKVNYGGKPFTETGYIAQLSVHEENDMIYIVWEGADGYLASVAKAGEWVVRDQEVFPESYGIISGRHIYLGGFGEDVRHVTVNAQGQPSAPRLVHQGSYMRIAPIKTSEGDGVLIQVSEEQVKLVVGSGTAASLSVPDKSKLLYDAMSGDPVDGYGPGALYADLESGCLFYSGRGGTLTWTGVSALDLNTGEPLLDAEDSALLIQGPASFMAPLPGEMLAVGDMRMRRGAGAGKYGILDDFSISVYNKRYEPASNEVKIRVINKDELVPGAQAMTVGAEHINIWNAVPQRTGFGLDLIHITVSEG